MTKVLPTLNPDAQRFAHARANRDQQSMQVWLRVRTSHLECKDTVMVTRDEIWFVRPADMPTPQDAQLIYSCEPEQITGTYHDA